MNPDPREELADILAQAGEYLSSLKDDGVSQMEVARGALAANSSPPVNSPVPQPEGDAVDKELSKIARTIAGCRKCPLHSTRTNTVPGQGNGRRPEVMFIGEAPGADEDAQGLAFIGRAGQLLTRMIEAMGYTRDEVFIANIAKCRPPDNRQPTPEEMATCIPYLKQQIAAIQPKVIVALGAVSLKGLLGLTGIASLRGHWHTYDGIDLMPTFHPAYLLRNPPAKKEVWEDLQMVLKRLGRKAPPVKKS